jgi:hypothetical protein
MPSGSMERFENTLAFQRELVAVVDKWASRVDPSDGDAFVKELLGYYRIKRMLSSSEDLVAGAQHKGTVNGGGGGGRTAARSIKDMADLSSKTDALIAAASTGVTLARLVSDQARTLASRK